MGLWGLEVKDSTWWNPQKLGMSFGVGCLDVNLGEQIRYCCVFDLMCFQ